MKRSRLSYDEWNCIISKELHGKDVHTEFFEGHVEIVEVNKVSEPQIWRFNGEDITVCDQGIKWLSILPKNDYYCITVMMNEKYEILLWYIDMIASQGRDADGIPYYDDLYLDLIVYPDGLILEDDMDELEEALQSKDITQEQYQLALATSKRLKEGLLSDVKEFEAFTRKCLELIW